MSQEKSKEISTRDALLELRRFQAEDAENAENVTAATRRLDEALETRARRIGDALLTLEGYVEFQTRIHGFSGTLDSLLVETEKGKQPVREKKKKKRAAKKTIKLSPREQEFVDLLDENYPLFTSPAEMFEHGIVPAPSHTTAKVCQLRRKGVPIESATQARLRDADDAFEGDVGYRLIGR